MLLRNITNEPQRIVKQMILTVVQPGDTINLSVADMNHSKSATKYFQSVTAERSIKKEDIQVEPEKVIEIPEEETPTIEASTETENDDENTTTNTEEAPAEDIPSEEPSEEKTEEEPSEESDTEKEDSPKEGSEATDESADEAQEQPEEESLEGAN